MPWLDLRAEIGELFGELADAQDEHASRILERRALRKTKPDACKDCDAPCEGVRCRVCHFQYSRARAAALRIATPVSSGTPATACAVCGILVPRKNTGRPRLYCEACRYERARKANALHRAKLRSPLTKHKCCRCVDCYVACRGKRCKACYLRLRGALSKAAT